MVSCPNCGTTVEEAAAYCPECGDSLAGGPDGDEATGGDEPLDGETQIQPQEGTSHQEEPQGGQPPQAQGGHGQSQGGQPRQGQAGHGQPGAGQPSQGQGGHGQPGGGQPRQGQGGHGQPQGGQPRQGQGGHGQPQGGQPRQGQGGHGQPQGGQPRQGQGGYGQPQGGQPRQGQGGYGQPQGGQPRQGHQGAGDDGSGVSRRALLAGGGAVALAAGGFVAYTMFLGGGGPAGAVRSFVQALNNGNVQQAQELIHPNSPAASSLTEGASMIESMDVSISNIEVVEQTEEAATVEATISVGSGSASQESTSTWDVRKFEGDWLVYSQG